MQKRSYLKGLLAGESRAYGFTIAFWGSGSILINQFGVPNFVQAVSYGSGAITGFALLAIIAFKSTLTTIKNVKTESLVLSTIHYLAALIPLVVSKIIVDNTPNIALAFFLAGASVSIVYNSLSILEEDIAELIS